MGHGIVRSGARVRDNSTVVGGAKAMDDGGKRYDMMVEGLGSQGVVLYKGCYEARAGDNSAVVEGT